MLILKHGCNALTRLYSLYLQCFSLSSGSKEHIPAAADGTCEAVHFIHHEHVFHTSNMRVMYHSHLFNQKLRFDWEQRWSLLGIICYVYCVKCIMYCVMYSISQKKFYFYTSYVLNQLFVMLFAKNKLFISLTFSTSILIIKIPSIQNPACNVLQLSS